MLIGQGITPQNSKKVFSMCMISCLKAKKQKTTFRIFKLMEAIFCTLLNYCAFLKGANRRINRVKGISKFKQYSLLYVL